MPRVLDAQPSALIPPEMERPAWTRDECAELERLGLLERERFELINGQLVPKMSKSPAHSTIVALFVEWLRPVFPSRNVLQEAPIDPSGELTRRNEPEPDAIVLSQPLTQFRARSPQPADILLLVAVAVTTVAYDLGPKAALYASAGIADYWVLDIAEQRIVIHRNPSGAVYTSIVSYAVDEPVSPLAAPAVSTQLAGFIG